MKSSKMSNRREIVKNVFQRLFEELAPLVSAGYPIDKAIAAAPFTPIFASEADKCGILRFFLTDDLKKRQTAGGANARATRGKPGFLLPRVPEN
jgi:hypothetical protein